MTKQQLVEENERLIRQLREAIEANRHAIAQIDANTSTARRLANIVPLSKAQDEYIRPTIEDVVSRCAGSYGEDILEEFEPINDLLPGVKKYLVSYDFDRNAGIMVGKIWAIAS